MFLQNTEYVDLIKRTIKDELSTVEHYEDRGFAFDYVKMKIRDATITFAKKFHSEQKQLETDLTHRLDNLSNEHTLSGSADILEVMDGIKKELEQIQYLKTKGAMLRSKLSNIEYGERNSAYFLSLMKYSDYSTMCFSWFPSKVERRVMMLGQLMALYFLPRLRQCQPQSRGAMSVW